jgi:hypothetical protein
MWAKWTFMRGTTIACAKAHCSAACHLAAIKGQPILIPRHGKPTAMIGPVDGTGLTKRPHMTAKAFDALLDRMIATAPHTAMTSKQALGRHRLDRIA